MNKVLYIIGICLLISSCGLFSSKKQYSYIKEQEKVKLILSPEQQKSIVFDDKYAISTISNTNALFYPEAPPRPNSQLQLISKTGVVYTWNKKDTNNWIDATQPAIAMIQEIKEFLAEHNIKIKETKINGNTNTIATIPESFYYTDEHQGFLGKLQKKGLAIRTKDESNYEGRYIIVVETTTTTLNTTTNLKITHQSIALNSNDQKVIPLENNDRKMSNDLLKKLWLHLSNKN